MTCCTARAGVVKMCSGNATSTAFESVALNHLITRCLLRTARTKSPSTFLDISRSEISCLGGRYGRAPLSHSISTIRHSLTAMRSTVGPPAPRKPRAIHVGQIINIRHISSLLTGPVGGRERVGFLETAGTSWATELFGLCAPIVWIKGSAAKITG